MSLILAFAPYLLAYCFLSVCVALVVGRVLRVMHPIDEMTDLAIEMTDLAIEMDEEPELVLAR